MNKSLALVFSLLIALSAFTACNAQKSDTNAKTTKTSTTAATVAESSLTSSISSKISVTDPTTKQQLQTTDGADNDIDFGEVDQTSSSEKITKPVSSVADSTTNKAETTILSSKGNKAKITTDKDGWVDKWY